MLHKKVSAEKRNEFACEAFNRRNEIPKKLKLSKIYRKTTSPLFLRVGS